MKDLKNIIRLHVKSSELRCLFKTQRWLSDMLISLDNSQDLFIPIDEDIRKSVGSSSGELHTNSSVETDICSSFRDYNYVHDISKYYNEFDENDGLSTEYQRICIAKTYFHQKNFTSALTYLTNCKSYLGKFLERYGLLLNFQRHKWETSIKSNGNFCFDTLDWDKTSHFSIRSFTSCPEDSDAYLMFVTALINKELKDVEFVKHILLDCINKDPNIWPAWFELSQLMVTVKDINEIAKKTPKSWLYNMFILEAYIRIGKPDAEDVLEAVDSMKNLNFDKTLYYDMIQARLCYLRADYAYAREIFKSIRLKNPAHTEHMDMYSNILFTLNDFAELTGLVKDLFRYAKYNPETFFAAGNLYTLAAQHEKAATHFKQAIRLNPYYIDAWTLLGHEFIELKDVSSAIFSYRKAVELDKHEYRAWYGLGMVNEVIKKKDHALAFYERALTLRPDDTRVLKAVASISCKLGQHYKAEMILRKLYEIKENDEDLLLALANMVREKYPEEAADLYIKFMNIVEEYSDDRADDISYACMFVMQYFFSKKNFKMAELYAKKGLRYNVAQTTATYMLKKIDVEVAKRKTSDLPLPNRSSILPDFSIDLSDLSVSTAPSRTERDNDYSTRSVISDGNTSEMEFSELESSDNER